MKKLYLIVAIILLISFVSAYSLEVIKTQEFARLQTEIEPSGEIYNYTPRVPTYELKLKTIQFIPEEMSYDEVVSLIAKDNTYYLAQFKSLSISEYALLKLYNIETLGYLPDDTYIVKILNGTRPMLLYGSIRWIDIMQPEWKIDPEFKNYIDSLGQNETVNISLRLFEPINENQLNDIKNLSERVVDFGQPYDFMSVEVKVAKINDIAALNFVNWISKRSLPSLPRLGPKIFLNETHK